MSIASTGLSKHERGESAGRIADDLIVGAAAIGLEIGKSERMVNYLYHQGKLPFVKMFCGRLTALRSVLREEMRRTLAP
jgi:hypothetical protein